VTPVWAQLPLIGEIQRKFGLTQRQAEVARMLATRLPDAEIAKRLGVSWHTVRSHVDGVLREMGAHSRQEIIDRLLGE
jgi:DNA-binding CsgD family transcriptional regulator